MTDAALKTDWNSAAYLEFAAYRARPAEDLIARIALDVPGAIVDLGCGPGNVTRALQHRWPERAVTGFDSSPRMLADARAKFGASGIVWEQGDIAAWTPATLPALVFANASLQWVPDHARLFPRLMQQVADGGVLAVQMPMTGGAPYHLVLREVLKQPKWRARLAGIRSPAPPGDARLYYDLLSPLASTVDIWEGHYHHVLDGIAAVTAWVSATALGPYTTPLDESERQAFRAAYTEAAAAFYPPQADGKVLFTMRRLFLVAKRR